MKSANQTSSYLTAALLFAFAVALSFVWFLISNSPDRLDLHGGGHWRQPDIISSTYREPISGAIWSFDYDEIEQTLSQIRQNEKGALILNEKTHTILKDAVSKFPNEIDNASLQRIKFLTRKSFGDKAGQQIADLLLNFYAYTKATERDRELDGTQRPTGDSVDRQERLFEELLIRQNQFMGPEISESLFGRKNALNRYLYARKRINEDPSLSQLQKQKKLSKLQARFKEDAR